MRIFARAVGEADQFFAPLWRCADQYQNALFLVFEPGLQVDAICPDVHVAFRRQIALLPSIVLVGPTVLEAYDGYETPEGKAAPELLALETAKAN